MKAKDLILKIQEKISHSELAEGFKLLDPNLNQESEIYVEFIKVKARYHELERSKQKGTAQEDHYAREKNKIRDSFLTLVEQIESKHIKKQIQDLEALREEIVFLKQKVEELENMKKSKSFNNDTEFRALKSLEGYWVELIPGNKDSGRLLSIGQFLFNENIWEFQYNGINYDKYGVPHYEWQSIELISNFSRNVVYYIYSITQPHNMVEEKTGFGLISFNGSKKLNMVRGYFIDAGDKKPKNAKHHAFIRLEDIVHKLNQELKTNFMANKPPGAHKEIIKSLYEILKKDPDFI